MTPSRYIIARCGQFVGISRKTQRMAEATSETHLLRDAEAYLGAAIWENAEHIEPLSTEYWNLRKLSKERAVILDKMADCQARLDKAHEERVTVMNAAFEPEQKLIEQRARLINRLEELGAQRDRVIREAREVRKTYEGLKMKLEFIRESEGSNEPDAEKVRTRLAELKVRFIELKNLRLKIGKEIEEGDKRVDALENNIVSEKKDRKADASGAFMAIGDANKDYTLLRADIAIIDSKINHYQFEIGRYMSRNAEHDPECAKAVHSHRGLIQIMAALRRSIAFNHRLAGIL